MAVEPTKKTLYCIRHGESTFNEWRKQSIRNFSWIWVRDPMIIDAPLSAKGELQVRHLHRLQQRYGWHGLLSRDSHVLCCRCVDVQTQQLHQIIKSEKLDERIEVIITSPLTRAVQTMVGGFQDANIPILQLAASFVDLNVDFHALDQNWWLPPHKRPADASGSSSTPKTHEQVLPLRESAADVDARIEELLTKLRELPEKHIAVVGHSAFFKRMLGMNRKLHNCELYEVPFAEVASRYGIQSDAQ